MLTSPLDGWMDENSQLLALASLCSGKEPGTQYLDGLQSWSRSYGEGRNILPLSGTEPLPFSLQSVAISAELSRLQHRTVRHKLIDLVNVYLSNMYPRSQLRIYWCYFSLSSQHVSAPSGHPQVKYNHITYISREFIGVIFLLVHNMFRHLRAIRPFQLTAELRYLETTATNQNLFQGENKRRLNSGNTCYLPFGPGHSGF
jgi:hypothetical protein